MKTPLETRGSRANDGRSARLGKKQPDGTHAHRIAHVHAAVGWPVRVAGAGTSGGDEPTFTLLVTQWLALYTASTG